MSLKPFLHQHHLVYDEYEKREACCDQCNLYIYGWAFTCETCKFWLHKSCAVKQLPLEISHPLHSQHLLKLVYEESNDSVHFFCKGCSGLTRRCLYRCRDCNFNLDLICASSTTITTSHSYREIVHFCHRDHPLIGFKYRKVNKYHYTCLWCHKLLSGVSYGCFNSKCSIESFVHKICLMNMPNIISKHHFHPTHQLQTGVPSPYGSVPCGVCGYRTRDTSDGYLCQKCQFFMHYSCLKFKPSLKHELHVHRLTLLPMKHGLLLGQCRKCKKNIRPSKDSVFNHYYRCVSCGFNFHLLCLIPSSIEHKYHRHDELTLTDVFLEDYSDQYYCDVCEEERKVGDPVYCCNKCTFVAHIGCALDQIEDDVDFDSSSTISLVGDKDLMEKLKEKDEINERNANFSTHFEIKYCYNGGSLSFYAAVERNEGNAICSVCRVEISDEAYVCEGWEYYMHKTCNRLSSEVTHPLHPQHSLKLVPLYICTDSWYKCRQCARVNMEFAYICYACDFVLDLKCATSWVPKTETQRLKDTERESKLCFFNQHHNLGYANVPYYLPRVGNCSFCGLKLTGPVYACIQCGYLLHESCVGFPPEMQIQFHPLHLLRPLLRPLRHCRVCRDSVIRKISYSCVQCDLHLHPYCAKSLKHVLKSKSHIHDLYYFGSNTKTPYSLIRTYCNRCGRDIYRIPFCLCMRCYAKLHIECVFPRSLKSIYHMHPLIFNDGFKEDDSGEYYCDICEEERDPRDHAYRCTECRGRFVAHNSCALNSVTMTPRSML